MGDAGLSSLLSSLKISSPDAKEIAGMAKAGGYQLACQRHFEVTHPGWNSMDLKIVSNTRGCMHPRTYFTVHAVWQYMADKMLSTTFSRQTDSVANHPNQWFQVSVSYHLIKSGKLPASSLSPPSTSSSAILPGSGSGSGELSSPEPNTNPNPSSSADMDAMDEAFEG